MTSNNLTRPVSTTVIGLLTLIWGKWYWMFILWVITMFVDWVTGTAAACYSKQYKSEKARQGIWHKAAMFVVVGGALILDILISLGAELFNTTLLENYNSILAVMCMAWYTVTEIGSIFENAFAMGAPIPKFIKNMLDKTAQDIDK